MPHCGVRYLFYVYGIFKAIFRLKVENIHPPADRAFAALAKRAGCVSESSTLGGAIIVKMICSQRGVTIGNGFSFFNGYGEHTLPAREPFCAYQQLHGGAAATNIFNYEPVL
ncbi:hypothetical protein MKQ68_05745 [Chitinophaga horti]|uniref:Uncharacterized protein n=1 Tax=Chitinophaga horti TaxID=2920382 RepID=A0ABY6J4J3_9BACT|nr:hypothetical protein [Chitinophaga horti]UYQ94593.1 hypothetical protein MKQ68_05745 [Chitinophaga horti]